MNISQFFIIGALGLVGLLATPTAARADDHRHHPGERHDYRDHGNYPASPHPRHHYHPKTVDDGYSNASDVTIAFGGHVIHSQHYRH